MKSTPFFKGLSWLLILNFLVKPVWIFFIDRQIQNKTGYEAYGKYFAILNLSYVLLILADGGLSTMLNQKLANNLPVNVFQLLKIKFLLLFTYVGFFCFISWITNIEQVDILFYVMMIQCFTSIYIFFRSIITANQYFKADAWFSVTDKLLVIILCAGFIYYPAVFGTITLALFLKIQLICTGIAVCSAFLFLIKKELFIQAKKEKTFSILKSVAPFALIILLMSMHYRLDGFLLERIHVNGAYETGVYAAAYRLLDAGSMVGYLAASFLIPFIARHQFNKKAIEDVVVITRHGLIFFGIGVVTFSLPFASWIQKLLYYSYNVYNAQVLQYCIAALPAYLLMHIYGSVLTATLKFKILIRILIASVCINVLINLLLIPAYGALGCCIAAIVSQYFCAITSYIVVTKSLSLSEPRSNSMYLFTAIALCAFFYFAKMTEINVWLILGFAVCIISTLIAVQTGYLKKYFISLR